MPLSAPSPAKTTLRFRLLLCLPAVLLAAGCARQAPAPRSPDAAQDSPASQLAVAAGIPPHATVVERVGGERVAVETLLAPGSDPHTFDPTAAQMTALGQARLYFQSGVPFENELLGRLAQVAPGLKVVDLCQGLEMRHMADCGAAHDHVHGEHSHSADPHTWLDPHNAKTQARTIHGALCEADPEGAPAFDRNLEALLQELDQVDARLREALEPVRGSDLLVFHPAFGYLADRYGLRQVAVEVAGKEPGPRQLAEFIQQAKDSGARVIFVQPQFPSRSAEAVARAIDGAVVPLDPLDADYPANLETMAEAIRRSLLGEDG